MTRFSGRRDAEHLGRLGVGPSIQDRHEGLAEETCLGCGAERTRVGSFHAEHVPQDAPIVSYSILRLVGAKTGCEGGML